MGCRCRMLLCLAMPAAFALAAARTAAQPPPTGPPAAGATFVGSEVCATCHEETATHLATTPHGKGAFKNLSAHGCETCHGPGSAHAENPDDPALRPLLIRRPPKQQSAVCLSCHDGRGQFFWPGSVHARREVSCPSCHSVHSFKSSQAQLKTASSTESCLTCHKDTRAELWKTSHHPIREGKMSCADCHNPHGTQTAKMIKAASVNDQCYTCHAEKRGPFLWEHPPVRENCMSCHAPHGSNHLKLQRTSVPYICQQCHSNTRHPGTLYDGLRVATPEIEGGGLASNRLFNRACVDCHAAIHGSNHPSSPYLAH